MKKTFLNILSWILFIAFSFMCISNIVIIAAGNFYRNQMIEYRTVEFVLFVIALCFVIYEMNWDKTPILKIESLLITAFVVVVCTLVFIGSLVSITENTDTFNIQNANAAMLLIHMLSFASFAILKVLVITKYRRYKTE